LRPAALTSAVTKRFEKIILKQHLSEVSPLLDPNQFPDLAERSCLLVKIVFIDFSSAFNTIQSHLLVIKLRAVVSKSHLLCHLQK